MKDTCPATRGPHIWADLHHRRQCTQCGRLRPMSDTPTEPDPNVPDVPEPDKPKPTSVEDIPEQPEDE